MCSLFASPSSWAGEVGCASLAMGGRRGWNDGACGEEVRSRECDDVGGVLAKANGRDVVVGSL